MRHRSYLQCLLVAAVWLSAPNAAPGAAHSQNAPTPQRPAVWPPITPENAGRVAELARLGNGWAGQVRLSPDRRLLAVASSLGVYMYDAVGLQAVRLIETQSPVQALDFSPDGTKLVVGLTGFGSPVELWRLPEGTRLHRLYGCPGRATTFSPDGLMLAAGGRVAGESGRFRGLLCVWRVADGTLLRTLEGERSPWGFEVNSVAFSPDSRLIASTYEDNTVRVWRIADGAPSQTLSGHSKPINSITFSPSGTLLASGSEDGTLRLWRLRDGALLHSLDQQRSVQRVTFLPSGESLLAEVQHGPARLWRVTDGAFLGYLPAGRALTRYQLIDGKDGTRLALTRSGGLLRLWRVPDGVPLGTLKGYYVAQVGALTFAPDGATLASASANAVWLWRMADLVRLRTMEGHPYLVSDLAFSPEGTHLLSASLIGGSPVQPAMLRLWQIADGEPVWTYRGVMPLGRNVAFSSDGKLLAFSIGQEVQLRRIADQALLRSLTGHKERTGPLAFSPSGATLAVGDGPLVRLWRVSDGQLQLSLRGCETDVLSLAFSPDGTQLAAGAAGEICLWRVSDGLLLYTLRGRYRWVWSLAFSPDNKLLASAGYDGNMRLWQVTGGTLLRVLTGHKDTILSVAFSPDGSLLASGSADGTIRLWGVR